VGGVDADRSNNLFMEIPTLPTIEMAARHAVFAMAPRSRPCDHRGLCGMSVLSPVASVCSGGRYATSAIAPSSRKTAAFSRVVKSARPSLWREIRSGSKKTRLHRERLDTIENGVSPAADAPSSTFGRPSNRSALNFNGSPDVRELSGIYSSRPSAEGNK